MNDFVMVPAGSLKPGDVVAVDGTPTRLAQPLAEVNHTDGGVELVFIEKSSFAESGIRIAGVYPDQHPVALVGDLEDRISEAVEKWLSQATDV